MEVSLNQLEKSSNRYYATKDKKTRISIDAEEFSSIVEESISPEIIKGNIIGDEDNLKKRKEMIGTAGYEPVEFAFERAIGKNDSVYTNFIALINEAKKKVCRIVVKEGIERVKTLRGVLEASPEELQQAEKHHD